MLVQKQSLIGILGQFYSVCRPWQNKLLLFFFLMFYVRPSDFLQSILRSDSALSSGYGQRLTIERAGFESRHHNLDKIHDYSLNKTRLTLNRWQKTDGRMSQMLRFWVFIYLIFNVIQLPVTGLNPALPIGEYLK